MSTALVTGAGMGIGRAVAIELAKAGYDVIIHCHASSEGAFSVAEAVRGYNVKAEILQADLTSKSGVDRLFDEVTSKFGKLELLVCNAGVTKTSDFTELDERDFDLMCELDLKGSYYCIARGSEIMDEGSSIVVISSNNAHMNTPRAAAYASVKAGLSHLARHAAVELAHKKIRVNTISPGWTDTGAARLAPKEETYYKIPLKRWVKPEEIGQAVLFLSSPFAASITGAELVMDGGASLMSDLAEKYNL